jgi:MarR family transcriptional regulator, 2-MHQ and catechol-resistance regulon repressor
VKSWYEGADEMGSGALQHELKKRQPFATPAEEAILNLFRTSDLIQLRFARVFGDYGLTSSQYNILRILWGEGRPLPSLEVAGRMVSIVPAITGLIDRLEAKRLVRRERSADDRRIVFVAITATALDLLTRLDDPMGELHAQLLCHLENGELLDLIRLLEKTRCPLVAEQDPVAG